MGNVPAHPVKLRAAVGPSSEGSFSLSMSSYFQLTLRYRLLELKGRTMKIRLGVSIAAALTVGAIPVDAMTPLGPFIVFFEQGSVELSDMSLRVLDNTAAALLGREPTVRLVLEGSTDRSGSTRSNHALACRRARAVRDRLVELGLEPERLVLIGYGEAPGGTADVLSSGGTDGIPAGARRHVHMWVTGSSEVVDVPQRLRCT